MDPFVMVKTALLAAMVGFTQAAAGVAGILNGAKLKLFVNDVNPGKGAVIGDFTLASFTGSAPISISAWGEAYLDVNNDANILAPLAQWDYDSGTSETVYGVVLTDSADGLLGYARFTSPKVMDDTSDSIAVVPQFRYGENGYGLWVRPA